MSNHKRVKNESQDEQRHMQDIKAHPDEKLSKNMNKTPGQGKHGHSKHERHK